MPYLNDEVKIASLNVEEGYAINVFTGDSAFLLLNANGEPLTTGKEFQIEREILPFDTNLRVIKIGKEPEIIPSESNTYNLGQLARIEINLDSTSAIKAKEKSQTYELINSNDSIIPTGQSISFKGHKQKVIIPGLIKVDAIEQDLSQDFGQKMEVKVGYNLGQSNIVMDQAGNIWSGYRNLVRNDGVYIQTYLRDNDEFGEVENLMIDSKNNVWFTNRNNTEYVLTRFDGQNFIDYSDKDGLYLKEINSIYEDDDSTIWVAMNNGVLLKINGEFCTYLSLKEGVPADDINDVVEDEHGEIWLATSSGVFMMKDKETVIRFPLLPELTSIYANTIYEDFEGNLWFGTDKGIFIKKEDLILSIDERNGLLDSEIYEISGNQYGDILVASQSRLSILNLKENSISNLLYFGQRVENVRFDNTIESIVSDHRGNFWINNWGELQRFSMRVNYYRDKSIANVRFIGENGEKIMALPNDDSNYALADEYQVKSGFAIKDSAHVNYYSLKEISNSEWVHSIIKTRNDYWFLSYTLIPNYCGGKVFRLREDRLEDFSSVLLHFKERNLHTIFADSSNVIWFGGSNNLIKYENDSFEQIKFPEISNQYTITDISEDSNGNLWLGTYETGIIKYNNESYTIYSEKEGLSGNLNTMAVEDKNGNTWIATNNGVDKFDDSTFYHYSKEQDLFHDGIIEIQNDVNGNIWALTYDTELEENIINFISVDTNPLGKDLIYSFTPSDMDVYDLYYGFPKKHVNSGDEHIYTGCEQLVSIDVNDYTSYSDNIPVIQLNNVHIKGQFYDFRNITVNDSLGFQFDSVSSFNNYPHNLILDYNYNHVKFKFSAVEWNAPNKIAYAYKLEGLDNDWNKVTKSTEVDYRGLSPGVYTFKVCARGESKEWSKPFEFTFTILPPWWLTVWAKSFYFLSALFLLILFIRWRMSKFRKRQIQLEREIALATRVIVEQKEEVEKQHEEVLIAYAELESQKKIVETKNKEITDSITYARRLQNAILPPAKLVKEWLNDSFILYKPKDIVSGDFYWMEVTKRDRRNIVFYAVADCTGHGVPGAMVSVVCSNALNRAIKEFKINDPATLLDMVSKLVQESFAQSSELIRDGMDIAICAVDLVERKIWFAGANNPLYRITDKDVQIPEELDVMENDERTLIEYKPDKQFVGDVDSSESFNTTEIQLAPGDCVYIFSDGFSDQFGGETGKKYKSINFKKFLLQIESRDMAEQNAILNFEIEHWKGEYEQVDDICVIGLRVNGQMSKIFTNRELEVIQKISEGKPSKIIALELEISKNTVDTHRKRIMAKTNSHNSAELINFCIKHEIL